MRAAGLMILAAALITAGAGQAVRAQASARPARTNQQGADFRPPATRAEWEARREQVRRRILVSCGLYPLWEKTPLKPQVYGRIQRDGYSIEKVVLETLPGFYLSGNLYRPDKISGKVPGILNPHGHWAEGRVAADLQARCAGQARMGAVAFLYDMVGFGDSKPFGHSFTSPELVSYGLNLNGLQLWNSIRALDWLLSLPEVDPERIACTGESGGGTQTFQLCAVDDRVKAAAPVCMVSHHFQGGCECENAPNLRLGTDNVELAACFAPRPLFLVGATGDWTSQILQRGAPEIRAVYRLYDAEGSFGAVVHQADHNYNQASRESVYAFFNHFLWKKDGPVREAAFQPETLETLTTWDAEHPRPLRAGNPDTVKKYLIGQVQAQVSGWMPASRDQWKAGRVILTRGLETLLGLGADPRARSFRVEPGDTVSGPGYSGVEQRLTRPGMDPMPLYTLYPEGKETAETAVVLVHPQGLAGVTGANGAPGELLGLLLRKKDAVVVPQLPAAENAKRQGAAYFGTYNRALAAERAQAVLDAVAHARTRFSKVSVLGLEGSGASVLLARPFMGKVTRVAVDAAGAEMPLDLAPTDERWLPGLHRYGGVKAAAALASPEPLFLHHTEGGLDTGWVEAAYRAENAAGRLRVASTAAAAAELADWVTK